MELELLCSWLLLDFNLVKIIRVWICHHKEEVLVLKLMNKCCRFQILILSIFAHKNYAANNIISNWIALSYFFPEFIYSISLMIKTPLCTQNIFEEIKPTWRINYLLVFWSWNFLMPFESYFKTFHDQYKVLWVEWFLSHKFLAGFQLTSRLPRCCGFTHAVDLEYRFSFKNVKEMMFWTISNINSVGI